MAELTTSDYTNITTPLLLTQQLVTRHSEPDSHSQAHSVADLEWNRGLRINVLIVCVVIGTIGCFGVCLWMWYNTRRKSRVNTMIMHLTVSDVLVLWLASLGQIIWEFMGNPNWLAGNGFCKIFKFLQTFSIMASNYILVVIGIDRHQAIRAPLKEPFAVWKMAGVGWGLAGVFSTPQLYIFSTYQVEVNTTNETSNATVIIEEEICRSLFKDNPIIHRQAYLTFIFVVNFFLPLFIIGICYIRIFFKIAEKVKEGKGCKKQSIKPGKVHLQSTQSSSLPKAKVKTLKMTIVIVLNFIICSTPYYVAEMIMNYGDWASMMTPTVWGLLGAVTTTNSVTNSYIFLLFNANAKCMRRICGRCPCVDEVPRHRDFDSSVFKHVVRWEKNSVRPKAISMSEQHWCTEHVFIRQVSTLRA
ncbi:gonadotropin-releasing hormone receptor-like isoform X2 [Lineus longissimus]|uniref:gonadotropin-releasing hormone receptor-like isoform X2 n=1 Tax=Lineus longissimus TaxID=88925 RepID=UPI00315DFEF8